MATGHHSAYHNIAAAGAFQNNGQINFGSSLGPKERVKTSLALKLRSTPKEKILEPGTCQWIKDVEEFRSWQGDGANGLLWICGGPGKGKTFLSTYLASYLEKEARSEDDKRPLVLRYFCDTRDVLRSTELAVVLGLLNQLLEYREDLYEVILPKFYGRQGGLFSQSYLGELWECLKDMIQQIINSQQRLYFVLDGLDECDTHSKSELAGRLRGFCEKLQQDNGRYALKTAILSRPLVSKKETDHLIDLDSKNLSGTHQDIRLFITKNCCLEQNDQEQFVATLTERANDTFLWIALAMPVFQNDRKTQQRIVDGDHAFLDKLLPAGIDAMYNRMLLHILEVQYRKSTLNETVMILHCLAVSLRPLTRGEVCTLTGLDSSTVMDTLQAFKQILSKGDTDDSTDGTVELVHLSLREYLARHSSSLLSDRVCWDVAPRLSTAMTLVRKLCFQLYLFDHVLFGTALICFWEFLYQHLALAFLASVLLYLSIRESCYSQSIDLLVKVIEFLLSHCLLTVFGIHEKQAHQAMFDRCVALMDDAETGLKRDICDIRDAGSFEKAEGLSWDRCLHLKYACRYFASHLERGDPKARNMDKVFFFLRKRFLHWLETMILLHTSTGMNEVSEIAKLLTSFAVNEAKIRQVDISPVYDLLYDIRRFIVKYGWVFRTAPLQFYSSALVFAPEMSVLKNIISDDIPNYICQLPSMEKSQGSELQILEDHSDFVTAVSFSPDSKLLASAAADGARLWCMPSGSLCRTITSRSVLSLTFSRDGKLLALFFNCRTVELHDTASGTIQQIVGGTPDSIKHLGLLGFDCSFAMPCHLAFGSSAKQQPPLEPSGPMKCAPNGAKVASASHDGTINLWSTCPYILLYTFGSDFGKVCSMTFSPNSKLLAASFENFTIKLWDVESGTLQFTLEEHEASVNMLSFSPDGQLLASGSTDEAVILFEMSTGTLRHTFQDYDPVSSSVVFSPDAQLLIFSSSDNHLCVGDTATGSLQKTRDNACARYQAVAFSPDGRLLASGAPDHTVRLWNIPPKTPETRGKFHSSLVSRLMLSPDCRQVVASCANSVMLFKASSGIPQSTQSASTNDGMMGFEQTTALGEDPTGDALFFQDRSLAEVSQSMMGHEINLTSMVVSLDNSKITNKLLPSKDETMKMWDLRSVNRRQSQTDEEEHGAITLILVFSFDDKQLAAGYFDDVTGLWHVDTLRRILKGNNNKRSGKLRSIAFSSDRKLAAELSELNTLCLMDIATGTIQHTSTTAAATTQHAGDPNNIHISISKNGAQLKINRGLYRIEVSEHESFAVAQATEQVTLEGDWLLGAVQRRADSEWRSSEYWPMFSTGEQDGNVVVAYRAGRVTFFKLRLCDDLDRPG